MAFTAHTAVLVISSSQLGMVSEFTVYSHTGWIVENCKG